MRGSQREQKTNVNGRMAVKRVPSTNVGTLPRLSKTGLQKAYVQMVLIHRKALLPGSPENEEIGSSPGSWMWF